ncbi:hypothetical protein SAMN05444360_10130 [Chryseobacterium carnipullorum]|uniref:Uncharacterized protein n=1 Tax=Chryseobacterium carnipullorum TaxID=1124835 RepID=A0A1M6ZE88_CHRCU|nr:hypothetical protein SAMN05444360_10130 [Chryseobacterium carnipullorum]STD11444.1 Uncharacterised protein [Chryseobacterium carnipullorum]
MKKQNEQEKKLSLKKTQIMKINDMKMINGGSGGNMGAGINDGCDEPLPTPLRHTFVR